MPIPPPILAKIPVELWIYLFFGVLWLIGVIHERIKKRNAVRTPERRPEPTDPPDGEMPPAGEAPEGPEAEPEDLRELERQLRRLLGAPELEPEPAPRPRPVAEPVRVEAPPAPAVIRFDPPPRPVPAPDAPAEIDAFAQVEEIRDIEELTDAATAARATTAHTHGYMVNLGRLKLPLLRIPVSTSLNRGHAVDRPDLRRRDQLRDAVVANTLLGRPKGLD
jgi:hypothetical protein